MSAPGLRHDGKIGADLAKGEEFFGELRRFGQQRVLRREAVGVSCDIWDLGKLGGRGA